MRQFFDFLQVLFWNAAYFTIIWCIVKHRNTTQKQCYIPIAACFLNFGWEIAGTIILKWQWQVAVWLILDSIIFIYCAYCLDSVASKVFFVLSEAGFAFACYELFQNVSGTMATTAFVIDLIMALLFVIRFRMISHNCRLLIGILKMLGDAFAWLAYANVSNLILILGLCVFLVNLLYISCCIEFTPNRKKHMHRRKT